MENEVIHKIILDTGSVTLCGLSMKFDHDKGKWKTQVTLFAQKVTCTACLQCCLEKKPQQET